MFRLFSIKFYLKCLIYLCFFSISYLFVKTHLKVEQFENSTSLPLILLDKNDEYGLSKCFEEKRQKMHQSPFRTILPNKLSKSSNKTSYLIYEYTQHRQFCRKQIYSSIYTPHCPYQNCRFTCDFNLMSKADAILMLYSRLTFNRLLDLNTRRNFNQIWLFWHDEPFAPASIYNKFLFNWTITYRLDSEVSIGAYGITILRNKPMNQFEFNQWINKHYAKQHNEAVWFVSNCNSKDRLKYYQQLKKYFSINAFGKCIINDKNQSNKCNHRSQCELEKLSNAKFYLAFESTTFRRNYITEKFWRALSLATIPIVLGPKRQDYERIAPPNSFIYAKDYDNPQTLAKHLYQIGNNRNEYEKYHRWRIDYQTYHRGEDVESFRFCELCYRLNTNRDRIWYTNINKYFLETHTHN